MQKNTKRLPLGSLELNTGQLDWLPRNPREWSEEDMALMVASLDEDPDFMDDRPPLVVPSLRPGRFVVFGGNMRTDAEKRRATPREDILCIIYFPESEDDRQTVIRRAMKDNGHYGKTDWDVLANEWSDFPLGSWGINVPEGFGAESGGGEGGQDPAATPTRMTLTRRRTKSTSSARRATSGSWATTDSCVATPLIWRMLKN